MHPGPQIDSTTIVAVATPPGRGGVSMLRLSGPDACRITAALFPKSPPLQPRHATYRVLREANGTRIDDALLTLFPAPGSYTGEDVVEIATHGSPVVQDWVLRACVAQGAMPARPGEFSERAFLNGRFDLTGAEAVRDLIDAQTLHQAQLAARQMGGAIAETVRPTKQALLQLIAMLEAGIDFAEDDLDVVPTVAVHAAVQALLLPLIALLATFHHGRLLREGLRLAIVGEPNVGKSSLFNRLLQQERAIVTSKPGTTRDLIAERFALDGIPVELLDTAGLRETDDEAERMGIARSHQALAEADAVLLVLDASHPQANAVPQDLLPVLQGRRVLRVLNKVDLASSFSPAAGPAAPGGGGAAAGLETWPTVQTSALTGDGISSLKEAILCLVRGGEGVGDAQATLTNLRQQEAVAGAVAALQRAQDAVLQHTPHEMVLLDLYEALRGLDELTGETTPDDVLHLIFSTFCIGK